MAVRHSEGLQVLPMADTQELHLSQMTAFLWVMQVVLIFHYSIVFVDDLDSLLILLGHGVLSAYSTKVEWNLVTVRCRGRQLSVVLDEVDVPVVRPSIGLFPFLDYRLGDLSEARQFPASDEAICPHHCKHLIVICEHQREQFLTVRLNATLLGERIGIIDVDALLFDCKEVVAALGILDDVGIPQLNLL